MAPQADRARLDLQQGGWEPEAFKQFSALPPDFAPGPLKDPYDKVAPDPKRWPVLVAKLKEMEIMRPDVVLALMTAFLQEPVPTPPS